MPVAHELDYAKSDVVILQPVIPHYRLRLFEGLYSALNQRLLVLAGDSSFSEAVTPSDRDPRYTRRVRNVYLLRRHLLWQKGAIAAVVRADIAILGLNPRELTTWAGLLLRRVLRRPTVLWGHAWGRTGTEGLRSWPRLILQRLGTVLLVYTDTERGELTRDHPSYEVVAANNAVTGPIPFARSASDPVDVLYSGRLVEEKRLDLLVSGFAAAAPTLSPHSRLILIGDGPMRSVVESTAAKLGIQGRVHLAGAVTEIEKLRSYYERSFVSVSAGFVGLGLIQSLAFGVPMLIADSEPHAPEIEAANSSNSMWFRAGNAHSLSEGLVHMFNGRSHWTHQRERIARECQAKYTVGAMIRAFQDAIYRAMNQPRCR